MSETADVYTPKHNIRAITATSLFDGHDASINIMRRILQDTGVEVIHLGHNRSVQEIVTAAIDEDVQGIAVSSYQGGHLEFFRYMVDLLKEMGAHHIKVFGGGGGVIIPEEIEALEQYGVTRIFSPEDGAELGLQGMVNWMVRQMDFSIIDHPFVGSGPDLTSLATDSRRRIAGLITAVECAKAESADTLREFVAHLENRIGDRKPPILGITGTGGAGKSSLTDELILRFTNDFESAQVAVLSVDPSRRRTGGALLGDRIRMNAIDNARVYMRSMATRKSPTELPEALREASTILQAAGFDLIIIETAGIGQGDANIVDQVDVAVYVMTSEFGAASQLEKIDMLDYADLVVVNKFEKQGSDDALRDVRKQVQRNRKEFDMSPDEMPVFGTIASKFNDDGVTALYQAVLASLFEKTGTRFESPGPFPNEKISSSKAVIIPPDRVRYLSEVSGTLRHYHGETAQQAEALRMLWHLEETAGAISGESLREDADKLLSRVHAEIRNAKSSVTEQTQNLLDDWRDTQRAYREDELIYQIRDREIRSSLVETTLSETRVPKVMLPGFKDPGEIYRWLREENLPGYFPYTAGVFPLRREDEDPTRMFAGEGGPARTNRRFRLLSEGSDVKRLSTAFDAPTLYGCDPDPRPDIYGKVGTAGVSICTLDDMKALYDGFDLCAPNTSVSMTINGPAPIILAMFLNTAIDQQIDTFSRENGRPPDPAEKDRLGASVMAKVRGTVQADILKEDQGQNTCIFSIEFALKMMGDIQEYFIENNVRNFYSVSISGYHIAEAGANPITQLALTLANGFTYVEYYLSRGMDIDSFAPSFSFFFSNGMDIEYTVIGRVARRIWSIAMAHRYGGARRSQMLKYHIQTSGRSLHSQDIQFNDIRTTLQALCAIYDNCNSLHTNAFDEAITTPSPESVRRALAIQLIVNQEWGSTRSQNFNQGSFIVEELTRLVEEAVLLEFDRITEKGGVLGAMETGYQRSRIQEESIRYEKLKHSGQLPIIGVNTFRNPDAEREGVPTGVELARTSDAEKTSQLERLKAFKKRNETSGPEALEKLKGIALSGGNIFEALMETVRSCSLGDITRTLYSVGGKFRRNM